MSKIVVTGATSMLGVALIEEALKKQDNKIYAVVRENCNKLYRLPKDNRVTVVECDINQYKNLPLKIIDKCDIFYHFAWTGTTGADRNNLKLQNANISYSLDVVEAAKKLGCHTFLGAGSQAEYGRVEGTLKPDTPVFPENGYGIAKLCAGHMTREFAHQNEMRHIWVRVLSVYGPHDGAQSMVMSTIDKLQRGETPQFTKGEQMWDYLYSSDAAKAFYLLGEKGVDGKTYVLGSGNACPLFSYIKTIRDVVNQKAELAFGAIPYSSKQVMYLKADISDLNKDVGWRPNTDFKEGIKMIIDCVKLYSVGGGNKNQP